MSPSKLKSVDYGHFDALIFDMDGTLVDSGQLHEVAWTKALTQYGIPVERDYMRSLAGVPTLETVIAVLEKFDIDFDATPNDVSDLKVQTVKELMFDYVKPTALAELVRYYRGKKPMAVGTGAQTQEAHAVLNECALLDAFGAVVGADQVADPKPSPDTFLRCAKLLGVDPARCVVFEDSPLGLSAAQNAGMAAVDVAVELNIHNDYFL